MVSCQKITTEEKTKNEKDKQMAEAVMSENVEKRKENDMPRDNVQAMLSSVDASQDSVYQPLTLRRTVGSFGPYAGLFGPYFGNAFEIHFDKVGSLFLRVVTAKWGSFR